MKSISRVLGIIGVVCIVFGLGVGLFTGAFKQPYVIINLGLGGVLVLVALIVNAADIREGISGRSAKEGASALVYAVAVIAILVIINFIAARNHTRIDLTENKQYSLADASVSLLGNLGKEVKVVGFFVGGRAPMVEDLLESYRYRNRDRFQWELVDPDKRPELAEKYGIRSNATLVVESEGERKTLNNIQLQSLEESLTNAILAVTASAKKTLCAVDGHGERDLDDRQNEAGFFAARQALEGENYAIEALLLASVAEVPERCTILMIADPQRPFFEHETKLLDAYLEKGGRLFAMLEPRMGGPLVDLLEKWGVEVQDDIIVDKVMRLFEGESLGLQPIVASYAPGHPITREFNKQTIFTQARSLKGGAAPEGYSVTEIALTSPESWGESEVAVLFKTGEVALDASDRRGPVAVAAAVGPAGDEREGKAKIVVVGDADFANNRYLGTVFNGDLFLNMANWLTDQEKQISIRPRGPRASFVRLTDDQMAAVFHLAVLILPQLLLTVGILVGWRRR